MKKVKVSILVPIYNAAEFLPVCLESLHAQTLKELEIICLNDGSTDDSLKIVKEFARHDDRFVVVTKKNTGYGATMNLGLSKARGEYVGLVEADDFVDADMAEYLYIQAKKNKADIAKSDYYIYRHDLDWRQQLLPVNEDQAHLSVAQTEYLLTRPATIWTALYRREFLEENDLKFLDLLDHRYQDTSFAFKTLASANRVFFTVRPFYHYRQHAGQSVASQAFPTSILKEYAEVERYLLERGSLQDWAGALTLAKFYGYKWNTARLSWPTAHKFLTLANSDWRAMREAGIFDTHLFGWREHVDLYLARWARDGFIAKAKVNRWREGR